MTSNSFHLGAAEILEHVSFGPLVDDLARMHRETPADLRDMLLEQPGKIDKDYCLIRAAWQGGSALGVKIASVFPANVSQDLPAIHAAYVLFDGINGVPVPGPHSLISRPRQTRRSVPGCWPGLTAGGC